MKQERTIKGLTSQVKQLRGDVNALQVYISNKQSELDLKLKQVISIENKIKKLDNNKTCKVSEHAIVRYFERVKGFNIDEIRAEILSQEVLELIREKVEQRKEQYLKAIEFTSPTNTIKQPQE